MLLYMLIQGFAIAEPSGLTFPLPMMLLLATWAQPGAEAFTRKVSENTLAVRETPLLLPRPS
jgi:hypothetical protein